MEFLDQLFNGTQGVEPTIGMVLLAMSTATVLSLIITIVYQKTFTGARYSQAFVHTIIMMSVIVSVVMNVISDNAGVAFGLFAIFSLIRFFIAVYNVLDIAFIFFGFCVGMISGLYIFDLAIVLTLFASLLFYLLFKFQYGKGKDTQVLKVTVHENLNHDHLFDDIFNEYTEINSIRQIETTYIGTLILYTYYIISKNDAND